MKRFFYRHSITAMLSLFVFGFASNIGFAQPAGISVTATNAFGVTSSNQLIRFNTASPGTVTTVGAITGLQGGENILGIDFRPVTGELFALGSTSRLYTINKMTAAATSVGVISTALSGTEFGFDFNPTVDRIRIVSNTGQNLRVNPANGVAIVDGTLNGAATNADASAYTNSFSGATTTTLYAISAATDTLYTQNPPNAGTLVSVGALGVNVTDVNGFDILSTDATVAFAALTTSVVPLTSLYTINLTNGSASAVGGIGNGLTSLRGLAIETAATSNFQVFGVTTANNLVRFNSSRPNTILGSSPITGLQGGENVVGIDFRPANGRLYALGSNSRLYTINTSTGAATFVSTLSVPLNGTSFGVDFNPVPDRLRLTSDTKQNLRINVDTGAVTVDGMLNAPGGTPPDPTIGASAYTNSFAGATTTTLYNIDFFRDRLTIQNPPNDGTQTAVGQLGVDTTGDVSLDIAPGNNTALASLTVGSSSALYSVNLSTGSASSIGPIGGGVAIRGIAIGRSSAAGGAGTNLDFDGDGRTDNSVFRLSNSTWFINRSSNNSVFTVQFGIGGLDILTPGDYDGDGITDISVWRPSNGVFYVLRSSDSLPQFFQFGLQGDEPVARDYDGDGITDFAVVRRTGGQMVWYIINSSNGTGRVEQFGLDTDITAPGDYDGDGRFDLAVRRGSGSEQAVFFIQRSTLGLLIAPWGQGGDLVVPGDYDGDGRTDLTALRAGTQYTWFILRSSDGGFIQPQFGAKPHFSTQGDYDGDGKTDVSTWDPIQGVFYSLLSSTGLPRSTQFGLNGDMPVANYDTH